MKDYEQYCHEYLSDEWKRLRDNGRTGVEALIAADNYQKRLLLKSVANH